MKTGKDIRYYIYIASCVLCLVFLLPVVLFALQKKSTYPVSVLTDGWNVERGEIRMENVSRTAILSSPIRAGDSVLLTHPLPAEEVPDACVHITAEYALLRVFVDGIQVYSFDEYEPGTMIPVETHVIRLPEGYAGKELSFMLIAAQSNAFQSLQPVVCGNQDDLEQRTFNRKTYGTIYGIFLTVYGIMLFVLSVYLLRHVRQNLRLLFSALVLFLGGLCVLSYSGFFDYVFYSPLKNNEIGLVALYLVPGALSGLFASLRRGLTRRLLIVLTVFNVLWALLMIILYSSKNRFYPLSYHLSFFRLLVIAGTVLCGALFAYDYYLSRKNGTEFFERTDVRRLPFAEMALFTGACAVSLCECIDVVLFGAFGGGRLDGLAGSGISLPMLALLFFAACLLQCYYVFAAEHLGETSRYRKLSEIAYTDPLTGHSNRAHCEVVMNELDATNAEFCMINMDVNGLKIINDTLGHAEGDRFLKGFAQILKIFFKNADLIGRMGGDEFLVILKNTTLTEATDRMDALTVLLHKMNRSESAFKYEASYGIAHSREIVIGKKSAEVYRLADERMYEMKRIVHARRGGSGRD